MNLDLLLVLFAVAMLLLLVGVVIGEGVWRKRFVERAASKDGEGEGVAGDGPDR